MAIIKSKVNTDDVLFKHNYQKISEIVADLRNRLAHIESGGSNEAKQHHVSLGKMLPRERIATLLDAESNFFELSQLAAMDVYEEDEPAAGLITGIGRINDINCMLIVNDTTVKGGTYFPITVKKQLRAQEIALQNHLPTIYLVDSGGAFLSKQADLFADRDHFGRIFYNEAIMSSKNIPQISVVMGSSTAGGAYVPAMSDENIMIKHQAAVFLAGPPLVKAATGEIVTTEDLGGADVHCKVSGVSDYYADDDKHALLMARNIVANLNRPKNPLYDSIEFKEPLYDIEEIYGIVSPDLRLQYDAREIIARVVDGSEFDEFKQYYGTTLVCGYARIYGQLVGILANNGVLFPEAALKGTHFIEICNQRKIPMIFFQNITGFMVGKHYEETGITKHGAKMVMAVACSTVPMITVITGSSVGAGTFAMCGRAYCPRFLWLWPIARISIMGGQQAANVLCDVKMASCKKQDKVWGDEEKEQFKQKIIQGYSTESHAYYSSARIWDDGVIDPKDTRKVLAMSLNIATNAPASDAHFGVFRM